jgi:hypothetical protein
MAARRRRASLWALLLCVRLSLALDTGLESATLCCGAQCVRLHEESTRAWELRSSLYSAAQTFPRVRCSS